MPLNQLTPNERLGLLVLSAGKHERNFIKINIVDSGLGINADGFNQYAWQRSTKLDNFHCLILSLSHKVNFSH